MAQTDLRFTFEPACNTSDDPQQHVAFDVVEFKLTEGLNECYRLEVELLSADPAIDFGKILDQAAVLTIWQGGNAVRHVHGLVSDFTQGNTGFRRTRYYAVVEPQLARTQLRSDWRIFQQKTVPAILGDIFKADHVTNYAINTPAEENSQPQPLHLQREYCVQAGGETDYDFIARLAAEEGFVYRFAHSLDGHQLLLTDMVQSFGALGFEEQEAQQAKSVLYQPTPGGDRQQPALSVFMYKEQVRTANQTQRDYTFTHPAYSQQHTRYGQNLDHQSQHYERYDYPGRYKQDAVGKPFTQTRIQSLRRDARIATATGDDARLEPGLAFQLTGHPRNDMNILWRPVRIEHTGTQHTAGEEEAATAQQSTSYSQTAYLIPASVDWRAPVAPKPLLHGPQIAMVVGPEKEEIYCDEWGRVKIQFPWDRVGKNDQHSSCWIRVTQGWGIGAGDGQMSIPRIGQEVLVAFLDSDPDQPMIVGRANNALNPTPYELPKHKTRSTWRSHTHKGEGYNEIRFEDEREQEEIYIHAQKDQNIEILHDETTFVGNDRSEHVERDEKITIGQDRTEHVTRDEAVEIGHDRKHHILSNELLRVDGIQTLEVKDNRTLEIGRSELHKIASNRQLEIGGNHTQTVQGQYQIEAGQGITSKTTVHEIGVQERVVLKAPGGKITIDASGITLEGNINIKGPMNQVGMGAGEAVSVSGSPLDYPIGTCAQKAS